jgi:hypothetical protein
MKRRMTLTLHIAVVVCSVGCWLWVDKTTWKHGGAQWAYWRARRDAEREEDLAPLLAEVRRWGFWRDVAWTTSAAVCAVGLVLMVAFRSKAATASFFACLVFTFLSFEARGIRF